MILRSPFLVGAGLVHTEPRSARPSSILKFLVSPPVLAAMLNAAPANSNPPGQPSAHPSKSPSSARRTDPSPL